MYIYSVQVLHHPRVQILSLTAYGDIHAVPQEFRGFCPTHVEATAFNFIHVNVVRSEELSRDEKRSKERDRKIERVHCATMSHTR